MFALIGGVIWVNLVGYLLSRALKQFRCFQQATIATAPIAELTSRVAIIVPVRNEIANIAFCLAGLTAQTGLAAKAHIIVVDDGSQDGTKAVVERYLAANSEITLVQAGPLPAGWAGKPHACWRGAIAAQGDWLCFVDADVRVAPRLIAAAIATAERQAIDMLSLHPRQELGSFWERVVIPAGLLVLACAKRFDPASQDVVNGQFLLIRRDAYFKVGGHSEVRGEICEDKALAARLKSAGFTLRVLAAPDHAWVRMYRDLPSMWEGFVKNAADALGSVGHTLAAASVTILFAWIALLLPFALVAVALIVPSTSTAIGALSAVVGTAIVSAIHFGTARHFRIPLVFGLTFTIGYTAVACLACHSVITQLTGRVRWKGRTYRLTKTSPGRA